eukprot:TRINITY_DN31908_c0_g2_i1.p1 TRINITY_DN31908_c0_g2~~TRINITY_DN31908_c0_g2_i1.p1  ORF type:complete len:577 (-),score=108.46 TRINITY_DN31908_c0_g2_i1:27-1499(-)
MASEEAAAVLAASALAKKGDVAARAPAPAPPAPLLSDILATPWSIWREVDSPRGVLRTVPSSPEAFAEHSSELDKPEPLDFNFQIVPDIEGAVHADTSRQQSASSVLKQAWSSQNGLGDQPWVKPLQELPVASSRDADELRKSSPRCPVSNPNFSEQPMVVREGLKVDTNTAQHLRMQWERRPQAVLIVAKPGDRLVMATLQDMAAWLASQGISVILEPKLLPQLRRTRGIRSFTEADDLEKRLDLIITIGGDGTLTWAVSLFKRGMPPVLSFAAGSLGFLTPYPLDSWVRTLTRLLDLNRTARPVALVCRMRLWVTVLRRAVNDVHHEERQALQVQCLNEVLVHRGKSGIMCKLDVGVDGEKVTLVQGDGLILATPTGSTAYSLAAGGSMVHPSVPAILMTPVSPHSLSFRPAVLPESAMVTVGVSLTARCGAALSIDGKDVCTLQLGDSVEVSMSPHPVPTICRTTETGDWFGSVHQALMWNKREEQK